MLFDYTAQQISKKKFITPLLFVEDVLLVGLGTLMKCLSFNRIINLFCSATEMEINLNKSSFHQSTVSLDTLS